MEGKCFFFLFFSLSLSTSTSPLPRPRLLNAGNLLKSVLFSLLSNDHTVVVSNLETKKTKLIKGAKVFFFLSRETKEKKRRENSGFLLFPFHPPSPFFVYANQKKVLEQSWQLLK